MIPSALGEEEKARLIAATDVIGRSTGKGLEIGFLDEDVPSHLARWYAKARFTGAVVISENHPGPIEAVEALAFKVLDGGLCTRCKARVAVPGSVVVTNRPPELRYCYWRRVTDCWVPGCLQDDEVAVYVAERQAKRSGESHV